MVKSAKLVAIRRHGRQVLLVRRREDKRWMFPGGRRRQMPKESPKACLRRELREELPKLKVGRFRRWKSLLGKNRYSGRKMSDAVFLAGAAGSLNIGAPKEIDRAVWRNPWSAKLTPTSRYIRNKLASTGHIKKR
jgi:ADP-ribose pyrophosphatase YjhB (NUDIX family)